MSSNVVPFSMVSQIKNTNPFMPPKNGRTPQYPKNSRTPQYKKLRPLPVDNYFSESAKKAAIGKPLPNAWRESAPPVSNIKSLRPSMKKQKRAPWDMKGRLQDAQAVNYNLKEKVEELALKEATLLEGNAQLQTKSKLLDDDIEKYNKRNETLEQILSEINNELKSAKKEKDVVLLAAQCQNNELLQENMFLKSKLTSLELQAKEISSAHLEMQSETVTYKILLERAQPELASVKMNFANHNNKYKILRLKHDEINLESEKLRNKIKALERC